MSATAMKPPRIARLLEHDRAAGQHLVASVPVAAPADTADAIRQSLLGRQYEAVEAVYLLDPRRVLVGIVPLARLLAAPPALPAQAIAISPAPSAHAGADQEQVASLAISHGLTAVPIVDAHDRLLGVVPATALLDVLRREHVEDIHRLAGIGPERAHAREALEEPPARRARHRLPWLLVGLLGSMLATLIVAGFEQTLQANLAVAFFVPGIVYLADAVGTQSEAIAVRGLSLSRLPLSTVLAGELRTGALIGVTLAALAFGPVWLFFGDPMLATAVALALLAASASATTIGFALPWLLARAGRDPAFGSGPIATIIQDVLSLLIYFGTVRLMLG